MGSVKRKTFLECLFWFFRYLNGQLYLLYKLWSNLTQTNISAISRFQHYAVKRIQGLPITTRSDMAESMVGINRLPSKIKYRKLMFLHKLMSLPSGSVSRDIFIKKLILFVNNQSCVTLGFIPVICKMLFK